MSRNILICIQSYLPLDERVGRTNHQPRVCSRHTRNGQTKTITSPTLGPTAPKAHVVLPRPQVHGQMLEETICRLILDRTALEAPTCTWDYIHCTYSGIAVWVMYLWHADLYVCVGFFSKKRSMSVCVVF
jgi:hypothetical protein